MRGATAQGTVIVVALVLNPGNAKGGATASSVSSRFPDR
jgi:hypothetical protein